MQFLLAKSDCKREKFQKNFTFQRLYVILIRYRMYMRARARARVYKKASARYTRKRRQGQINSETYTE